LQDASTLLHIRTWFRRRRALAHTSGRGGRFADSRSHGTAGRTTGRAHPVTRDLRWSRDTAARRFMDSDCGNTRCACLTLECFLAASRMAVLRDRGNSGYRARAAWTRRLVNRRSSLRLEAHRDSKSDEIRSVSLMSVSGRSTGGTRKLKAGHRAPEIVGYLRRPGLSAQGKCAQDCVSIRGGLQT
jgi:hypothetical protein